MGNAGISFEVIKFSYGVGSFVDRPRDRAIPVRYYNIVPLQRKPIVQELVSGSRQFRYFGKGSVKPRRLLASLSLMNAVDPGDRLRDSRAGKDRLGGLLINACRFSQNAIDGLLDQGVTVHEFAQRGPVWF